MRYLLNIGDVLRLELPSNASSVVYVPTVNYHARSRNAFRRGSKPLQMSPRIASFRCDAAIRPQSEVNRTCHGHRGLTAKPRRPSLPAPCGGNHQGDNGVPGPQPGAPWPLRAFQRLHTTPPDV